MTSSITITDVLRTIEDNADGEQLKLGKIISALNHRGFGPFLLAISLLTILPTGAIPGIPSLTALLIIFVAAQIIIGKRSPWIPAFIAEKTISRKKFEDARKKAEPYTQKFDNLLKPRLNFLKSDIGVKLTAGICLVLACFMPPLEVVPFAAMVPALAIALISLGLSAKDGVMAIIGFTMAGIGIGTSIYFLM